MRVKAAPFAALLVTGGVLLCRDRDCFHATDRNGRQKVLRFVDALEVGGRLCAHCRKELAPKPGLLK
jgi:hypothetical protein